MATILDALHGLDAAAHLGIPPHMTATMRAMEEYERTARWMREMQPAIDWARLQEQAETLRRIEELACAQRFHQLGLYSGIVGSADNLLGSSASLTRAMAEEAARQHALIERANLGIAAVERMREIERLDAHVRSLQSIAESTYRLNGIMQSAVLGADMIGIASGIASSFMPYQALERACGAVIGDMLSMPQFADICPIGLRFAPIVLPNVAATVILAVLNSDDLDREEIEESEQSLSELIVVDGQTLAMQLAAIHPKIVSCLQSARDARTFTTPERVSIVCGQLRRALDFGLKELAPEPDVRAWITNRQIQAQEDGSPKRLARITYIFRDVYCGPHVARMFFADCVVFNRLYSKLSTECHTGTAKFDDSLLELLTRRVEALLYMMSCVRIGNMAADANDTDEE